MQERNKIVEGYMCTVAWDHEIGRVYGGVEIYTSVDDLKRDNECIGECGIVKVKVQLVEVVQEETYNDQN